ncbi:GNAT family N-acetyltransferase [Paenibacillus sp. SC116]|uniref:GNAT family N-acetyltransferase n=1 Tax=Paenibacillus sp. SC116 TaxID=2968986 RepID=UPI00215B74A5|nr:N-acetyltransferase [Paenibacillus sp. SC116]MCR8843611.1 GNAT family N-acetyltransferase [Paenibacillus sp. SC116]
MFTVIRAEQLEFDPREQMSRIFAEGFSQWLGYFSNDKQAIARAFEHMFLLHHFYVAVTEDRKVVGMTACTDGTVSSVKLNPKELRKHLGLIKGTIAGLVLKKEFEATKATKGAPSSTHGSIEFVGTDAEFRGQGVAMAIIRHIVEHAPYEQFLIEEVADTNIPAIKLYHKLGFQEYKRKPIPQKRAEKIGINHIVSLKYVK